MHYFAIVEPFFRLHWWQIIHHGEIHLRQCVLFLNGTGVPFRVCR